MIFNVTYLKLLHTQAKLIMSSSRGKSSKSSEYYGSLHYKNSEKVILIMICLLSLSLSSSRLPAHMQSFGSERTTPGAGSALK